MFLCISFFLLVDLCAYRYDACTEIVFQYGCLAELLLKILRDCTHVVGFVYVHYFTFYKEKKEKLLNTKNCQHSKYTYVLS